MLKVLKHPLITHKLTQLRRKETCTKDFQHLMNEIAGLLAYEITEDIPVREIRVETPVGICDTYEVSHEIVLVPILRAGLGMVDGIRRMVPTAKVGHMGLYRDEESLEPVTYYAKFPESMPASIFRVLPWTRSSARPSGSEKTEGMKIGLRKSVNRSLKNSFQLRGVLGSSSV